MKCVVADLDELDARLKPGRETDFVATFVAIET